MNKEALVSAAKTLGTKIKVKSPEILIGCGIISLAGAMYFAYKAGEELPEVLDDIEEQKEDFEEVKEELTKSEVRKQTFIFYAGAAKKVVKIVFPAAALFAAGTTMILGSHSVMKERNAILISAYNALDASYKAYKDRVRTILGDEKADDIIFDSDEVVEGDTKKKIKVFDDDPTKYSPYAKFFDEFNPNWNRDPRLNLDALKAWQQIANNKFHSRGYLFLNEAYDLLGIPPTKEGQMVGWIEGKSSYVDFGIYDGYRKAAREFVNGNEASILLDFNVAGVIIDDFEKVASIKW